ncbi:MAG: 6-phosphofructokinase [Candidatus Aenigmatarchaeota archaeon]|nr:6-phosphofructokinase [Candidatus Aenigmarchaeota archaeon]
MKKRIAILTGGGHVATLNQGIGGAVIEAKKKGYDILGCLEGWKGMEEELFLDLNLTNEELEDLLSSNGTVLKSSRTKPDLERVKDNLKKNHIHAIIALGGEDTLSVAKDLYEEFKTNIVGWPKTMDNDLSHTYFCFGYPSAAKKAADTVRESIETAYAHSRVALITMFGRNTDWVVTAAGAYGNADLIIPAEKEFSIDDICERIIERYYKNNGYCVVAVAEGARLIGLQSHIKKEKKDAFGHEKLDPLALAICLGDEIEKFCESKGYNIKTANIALTYQLRNGRPIEIERRLAIEAGKHCINMISEERYGEMASIIYDPDEKDFKISSVPIADAVNIRKVSDTDFFDYENLCANESFYEYAKPFLGERKKRL